MPLVPFPSGLRMQGESSYLCTGMALDPVPKGSSRSSRDKSEITTHHEDTKLWKEADHSIQFASLRRVFGVRDTYSLPNEDIISGRHTEDHVVFSGQMRGGPCSMKALQRKVVRKK